jgi:ABC-type glycerol-3-phosphate transport system permease component
MTARVITAVRGLAARPRQATLFVSVHVFAVLFALIPVMPAVWVLFAALKDSKRIVADPLAPPSPVYWGNFIQAWEVGRFGTYFFNSIRVTVPTVIVTLVFSLLAAYAFAKMRFRGKDGLFVFFLAGLTIPLSVLIIPLFYEIRNLNLLTTPWALILPEVAGMVPFGILLLYSFIRDLPSEIMDAGVIDGCSRWQLLWHIVAPLTTPAMVTLVVFNFMWSWNEFLLPIVLIHEDVARTLPAGLNAFRGRFITNVPLLMAGATITYLPVLVVYLLFQRQFIRGISAGALK